MIEDYRILVIIAFILAFLVGILLLIYRKKIKLGRFAMPLVIIGGVMSLILIWTFQTTPSLVDSELNDYLLFHAPPEHFKSVILKANSDTTKKLFIGEPYKFTNPEKINKVITSLHTAKKFSPNHPQAYWSFLLTLATETNEITLEVNNTKSVTNGTLIYHWSSVTDGWLLGNYRCDALGAAIEKLTTQNDSNHVFQRDRR